ncbi:hypothetical protein QVD17_38517 [Tagetes erecta]|uniref:Uncharacterized protein n=1 Tax=Tagetes erecta TaxID=13708 RepID=A0AAD8NGB3_TARER|nr:hypothetical protein QVD17_38517 [Tagetes erecta]
MLQLFFQVVTLRTDELYWIILCSNLNDSFMLRLESKWSKLNDSFMISLKHKFSMYNVLQCSSNDTHLLQT